MRALAVLLLILNVGTGRAEDYHGRARLWFTLAAMPLQATGSAGRAAGMSRFPQEAVAFTGLKTECFGTADGSGLGRGHCLNMVPNGDFWVETYACDRPVLPPKGAFAACEGRLTVLGGTGRFAGITGGGSFSMLTTMIAPDGMQIIYAPGEIRLRW